MTTAQRERSAALQKDSFGYKYITSVADRCIQCGAAFPLHLPEEMPDSLRDAP